jgi:hypothetical protein
MALALWVALQAAGAAPAGAVPVDFDLAKVKPADPCASDSASEIVVCGRRRLQNDYPLAAMERLYREKPVRAEIGLGNGATGRVYLDQVEMPGGQISKRIMFGIKMPF